MSVRVDQIGSVTEIVLDRPDQRNALTPRMLEAVRAGLGSAGDGVLIRGEGRVFCAGFDLGRCVDDDAVLSDLLSELDATIWAMKATESPIVLAAHGAAIAGGCALLAGADVVVSDTEAVLGYPVLRLGISPAVNAPALTEAVGHGAARAMMLNPSVISGVEAGRVGLVHEVSPSRDDVLIRARELAAALAAKPRAGLLATKRWLGELEMRRSRDGGAGLATSLGLVGSDEQRQLLAAAWGARSGR